MGKQLLINILDDGVKHINIYSRGATELGRALSNFTRTPFMHPEYGYFESMEGFYFYVSTGFKHEDLRDRWGSHAKIAGSQRDRIPLDNFIEVVDGGCRAKVRCNGNIGDQIFRSTLPFAHYYVWGENASKRAVVPVKHQWIVDSFEAIRQELKAGTFK